MAQKEEEMKTRRPAAPMNLRRFLRRACARSNPAESSKAELSESRPLTS